MFQRSREKHERSQKLNVKVRHTYWAPLNHFNLRNHQQLHARVRPRFKCYMFTATTYSGMTMMQNKVDTANSFDKNWTEFKAGFSDSSGNFWLGNDNIHQLTNSRSCTLKITFTTSSGTSEYANYAGFKIDTEANGYKIMTASLVRGSSTITFDALFYRLNTKFTTKDQNNIASGGSATCATKYQAGFWYSNDASQLDGVHCGCMNLNGASTGFRWSGLAGAQCTNVPLQQSQMWLIC